MSSAGSSRPGKTGPGARPAGTHEHRDPNGPDESDSALSPEAVLDSLAASDKSRRAQQRTSKLRADLELTMEGRGCTLRDPVTGQSGTFNELEVSLLRMLDGQRPYDAIVENARQLGIPINVESLDTFIGQLDALGFLSSGDDPGSASLWGARATWGHGVRGMFQSGIRLLRMGKHAEAAGYFEALLAQEPDNIEARELLAIANRDAAAMSESQPVAAQPVVRPIQRGRRVVLWVVPALVIAAGATVAAYWWTSSERTSSVADRAGPVDAEARSPPPVDAAAVMANLDAATVIDAIVAAPQDAAPPPEDAAPEVVVDTAVVVTSPQAGKVRRAFLVAPRRVQAGEKLFEVAFETGDAAAKRALRAQIAELERIVAQDTGDSFVSSSVIEAARELPRVRKQLARARVTRSIVIKAPTAGRALPRVKVGGAVQPDDVLAEIEPESPR